MSPEPENVCSPEIDGANKNDMKENKEPPLRKQEPGTPRKQRERRIQPLDTYVEALSPSSSATSQVGDSTFEPTIDMMVNDFDDEQTLETEEALAALEQTDPKDEIATLQEESELPLEELLAKYGALPPVPVRGKKRTSKKSRQAEKSNESLTVNDEIPTKDESVDTVTESDDKKIEQPDVIVIESEDEEESTQPSPSLHEEAFTVESDERNTSTPSGIDLTRDNSEQSDAGSTPAAETIKTQRSHLLDLYPEQAFDTSTVPDDEKEVCLDLLYEDDVEEDDDFDEIDDDFVKKTIMVGAAYQALIPDGLSQYGDILPYENEDKLIWEPSQVNERMVEEYLVSIREIKAPLSEDEPTKAATSNDSPVSKSTEGVRPIDVEPLKDKDNECKASDPSPQKTLAAFKIAREKRTGDSDYVVKDNEQALHLLVQCGYDFKEALRRKRLVPVNDSMSLWSEVECKKFEEGIQKFGKDFVKIRQNQVRTRTMRELVNFYYLWKKSERRDQNFANADTVDHMEIYLNESSDYGSSGNTSVSGSNATALQAHPTARKLGVCSPKNVSIMSGANASSTNTSTSPITTAAKGIAGNQKKRPHPLPVAHQCVNKKSDN